VETRRFCQKTVKIKPKAIGNQVHWIYPMVQHHVIVSRAKHAEMIQKIPIFSPVTDAVLFV
jgi:hypothetical protein